MRRVFIEILDDGAGRAPRPPFSRGQRIEITSHVVANSVSGAAPISTEVSGLPIPPIILRNGIVVHLESGQTEGHVFGVALPGDYLRVRLDLGEEVGVEAWPHVTFGDWYGVVSPNNPSLGRCVHRDAQDAAPAGFSLVDRAEVADVVRLLDDDASTLTVRDVFGLAGDQERVAVVHDDVYGATLPELAQGDALAGGIYPSGVIWSGRSTSPVMNERAHLEPSDVLHVITPIARELQRWCAAGFVPSFEIGHEIHVALNGAVRFRPFSPQARDRSAGNVHSGPQRAAGSVATLVMHALLSPKKRRGFIPWGEALELWPSAISYDAGYRLKGAGSLFGLLLHFHGSEFSADFSTGPSLDEVVGALDVLQASLPPATPDRLAGLVAGLFPGRVAEEECTRETFAMLDERAFSPHH